jgi:tetratricopeptide (TPR) repeat protein
MSFARHNVLAKIVTSVMRSAALLILCLSGAAVCQDEPLGMLEDGASAQLLRLGGRLFVTAPPGEIFHSGDVLRSEGEQVRLLFCPDSARYTLASGTEVRFGERGLQVRQGRLVSRQTVDDCLLPPVARAYPAADLHFGKSIFGTVTARSIEDELGAMDPARSAALAPLLANLAQKLAANPEDVAARLKRIAVLEGNGMEAQTLPDLEYLSAKWTGIAWPRAKAFVHVRRAESRGTRSPIPGRSRALLIGISQYLKRDRPEDTIPQLNFAHRDAELFHKFARTPRGGAYQTVELLTDANATATRIRNAVDTLLGGAQQNDSLLLFISAHGTTENGKGYLLAHDSFPGDLSSTAVSMEYLADLIRRSLTHAARVIVYVDACRAGMLSLSGDANQIHALLSVLLQQNPKLLVFAACQPSQISVESPDYGGGHGAFSHFLYRALSGEADINRNQQITVQELVSKVVEQVLTSTPNRQLPSPFSISNWVITQTWMPGLEGQPVPRTSPSGPVTFRGEPQPVYNPRSLIDDARGLKNRRGLMPEQEFALETLRLSTELENLGQAVLVRYLEGEENPPRPDEFQACAEAFDSARSLVPESLWLEARYHFCRGRERVFSKDYPGAIAALEQSVRLDPAGAYSFNALGIAYLETAQYERAVAAFQEAVQRAPYWAYAWNNLALAQTQRGSYQDALRAYQQARDLNSSAPYIAYNEALLLQLLNRRREAESAYRSLLRRQPGHALAHNALGTLLASGRRRREAESEFRKALDLDEKLVTARYNLALLLSRDKKRSGEAMALWQENLAADPGHRPSLFGLAETLAKTGRWKEAVLQYEAILRIDPESAGVKKALDRARRLARKSVR